MSDLVWAAAIAAVPPTLAVVLTAWRQEKLATKQETKIGVVHDLANNRLSEALAKIEALQHRLGQHEHET